MDGKWQISRGDVRRTMDARAITQVCCSPVVNAEPAAGAQPAGPLLLYLIMVRGGIPGTMLRLGQKASSLGRSAENTFQLHDNTVSRRHAVITMDTAGAAWLTDLGSTNGTFVNGRRIFTQTAVPIGDGSRIQFGSATLVKFLKLDPCEEGFQRELYERSVRDNLTGLYNRGYFLNQIGPLAELNSLCELGLALLLVDIDHFKLINDNHGHHVGDLILAQWPTCSVSRPAATTWSPVTVVKSSFLLCQAARSTRPPNGPNDSERGYPVAWSMHRRGGLA